MQEDDKFAPCIDKIISWTSTLEIAYELVTLSMKSPNDKNMRVKFIHTCELEKCQDALENILEVISNPLVHTSDLITVDKKECRFP